MKRLFFAVMLLGILCSCASKPEPAPLFECRFHTEKDAPLPNGWLPFNDGFFKAPVYFEVKPYEPQTRSEKKNGDPKACTFTIETAESPSMYYYTGYYEIDDDTIIDVVADAAGKGQFSLGVELFDTDRIQVGERHQEFELIPTAENQFKNYQYHVYFLANENRRARYVRLFFSLHLNTTVTLKNISLNITPYVVDHRDSTYVKFQAKEAKRGN